MTEKNPRGILQYQFQGEKVSVTFSSKGGLIHISMDPLDSDDAYGGGDASVDAKALLDALTVLVQNSQT